MRTRAYRPEAPAGLEGRALLSGPSGPVVLPRRELNFIVSHMQNGFALFVRNHEFAQIGREIQDVLVSVPFERVDGLDAKIDVILDNLAQAFHDYIPGAVRSASAAVAAATIAEVKARVAAGDVVVR